MVADNSVLPGKQKEKTASRPMARAENYYSKNGRLRDRPKTLLAVVVAFVVATVAAVVVFRLWLSSGDGEAFPLWLAVNCATLPYVAVFLPFIFRTMKSHRERQTPDA